MGLSVASKVTDNDGDLVKTARAAQNAMRASPFGTNTTQQSPSASISRSEPRSIDRGRPSGPPLSSIRESMGNAHDQIDRQDASVVAAESYQTSTRPAEAVDALVTLKQTSPRELRPELQGNFIVQRRFDEERSSIAPLQHHSMDNGGDSMQTTLPPYQHTAMPINGATKPVSRQLPSFPSLLLHEGPIGDSGKPSGSRTGAVVERAVVSAPSKDPRRWRAANAAASPGPRLPKSSSRYDSATSPQQQQPLSRGSRWRNSATFPPTGRLSKASSYEPRLPSREKILSLMTAGPRPSQADRQLYPHDRAQSSAETRPTAILASTSTGIYEVATSLSSPSPPSSVSHGSNGRELGPAGSPADRPQSVVSPTDGFVCDHPGCNVLPFQTQYLLKYDSCLPWPSLPVLTLLQLARNRPFGRATTLLP